MAKKEKLPTGYTKEELDEKERKATERRTKKELEKLVKKDLVQRVLDFIRYVAETEAECEAAQKANEHWGIKHDQLVKANRGIERAKADVEKQHMEQRKESICLRQALDAEKETSGKRFETINKLEEDIMEQNTRIWDLETKFEVEETQHTATVSELVDETMRKKQLEKRWEAMGVLVEKFVGGIENA